MNDELQKQLAELLSKLMAVASDGAAWSGQQIPLLVQEKITFGRAWETALFVILVAATFALYRLVEWLRQSRDEFVVAMGGTFSAIGAMIAAIIAVVQLQTVLLVWFAPRLYIVEWLRGMATK